MIKFLKKILRLSTDKPMQRWISEKLSSTRCYLEAKPATEWTHEDHYLAVEYTVQRYLPADEARSESAYRASLETLKRKVDWNIANPEVPQAAATPDPDFQKWMEDKFHERFGHSMKR